MILSDVTLPEEAPVSTTKEVRNVPLKWFHFRFFFLFQNYILWTLILIHNHLMYFQSTTYRCLHKASGESTRWIFHPEGQKSETGLSAILSSSNLQCSIDPISMQVLVILLPVVTMYKYIISKSLRKQTKEENFGHKYRYNHITIS